MQREEPVGARLRDPGTEGRPGAAGLKGVGPDVSLVTGKSAGRFCPNSGGTTETVSALKPDGFRAVFVGGNFVEFEVKMVYTKEDYRALQKGVVAMRRKGSLWKKFMGIVGEYVLLNILLSIMLSIPLNALYYSGMFEKIKIDPSLIRWTIWLGALVLTLYDQWGSSGRFNAWLSWRNYKEKGALLEYCFFEDAFIEHTPTIDLRSNYSAIQNIGESKEHYFLFTGINTAHLLCKKNFVKGNPADFGPWVAKKLGKDIIKIR